MKKMKNILIVAGMMVTVGFGQVGVHAQEAPNPAAEGPSEEVVAVDNAPTIPEIVIPRTDGEVTPPNPAAEGPSEEVVAVDNAPTIPEVVIPHTYNPSLEEQTEEVVEEAPVKEVVEETVAPAVVAPQTQEVTTQAPTQEVTTQAPTQEITKEEPVQATTPATEGPSEEVVAVDDAPTIPEVVIPQTGPTEELTVEEVALRKTNGKQVASVLSVTSLVAGLGFLTIIKHKK
ncbi:hypothetical protein SAMN05421767_10665 [Granulicatella balaenopterae]|uniref:LPXTG-motif cell wall anchor domain-containing protein n=1 Tax=Granulicatella balaenopterae TaxID=137733 RepID=A0A1H9IRC4_9LACT|nr:hypothetical protein [Granulicatella balaenopterae]SEQ77130.1 hypothetical protein SAMN05421767_10665 [Granulicatella balaenopterae]